MLYGVVRGEEKLSYSFKGDLYKDVGLCNMKIVGLHKRIQPLDITRETTQQLGSTVF
jgi:hypothetical protein